MPGSHINDQQIRLYMKLRTQGKTQRTAAAQSGLSERSARRIDQGERTESEGQRRHWRTRADPLAGIWEEEIVPLLQANPELLPITVLEHLCRCYPDRYDHRIHRTLQRRMKTWKLQHGPSKEVMFRQSVEPGQQGLSDFTEFDQRITIAIAGEVFKHRFYHYRLAYSGWCYVKVICGGESYAALASGLQDAFWRSGGVPFEHRTDSLSAAFSNAKSKQQFTERYQALCRHYQVKPTRNNPGQAHENGAIESPHGHFKRRLSQALMLRGSHDFASLADYQALVDQCVAQINQRCRERFEQERPHLRPLPKQRTNDYADHYVMVTTSSTFLLKRVTYSVPSQWIGTRLFIRLYDERLEIYFGTTHLMTRRRVYAPARGYGHCIDYRHVINALARKPQAFRGSQLKQHLLPNEDYRQIWRYLESNQSPRQASHTMVKLLQLAAHYHCECELGRFVLKQLADHRFPTLDQCYQRFASSTALVPVIPARQHTLSDYDALLGNICHG